MLNKNYTLTLLQKENKRLIRENERLRQEAQAASAIKKEYELLITNVKQSQSKYLELIQNIEIIEKEYLSQLDKLVNIKS